jgi:cell division protein FtsW (lipid II flippase)
LILRLGEDLIFWMCLGVNAFALVFNVEFKKLGWLEWWWLGVFIALTTILAVDVDGTPDSPVVHQT